MEHKIFEYAVDPDNFTNMGEISEKVRSELKKLGLDSEIIRRITVAIYQGEINMIIHANGGSITVELLDECVRLILKDNGPGIENVEQAMTSGFSTASDTARSMGFGEGNGFTIMKSVSDSMTVHSKVGVGTEIVMTIKTDKHPVKISS